MRWIALIVGLVAITSGARANTPLTFDRFFHQHSAPMLMISIDDGTIVQANPAAQAFYGYPQLTGMHIHEINTLTPEQIREERQRAATAGRSHLFFRHRLANGQTRLMGVYTYPFRWQGEDVLVSSLYDTSRFDEASERHYIKRVEEQVDLQTMELRRANDRQFWTSLMGGILQAIIIIVLIIVLLRLRRSNRDNQNLLKELSFRNSELQRLSHVMAHHFQEPSRRLVSFSQQITRSVPADDRAVRIPAEFIEQQARRLSQLVTDVQRYLSLDHLPPELHSLDPEALLRSLYRTDPALSDLRAQDALTICSPLPAVRFDARRLQLIFHALLHNAWNYRHPERPLQVEAKARSEGRRVCFRVCDNGAGIDPEYRQQALELFSRLVPNTGAQPGTGMGLAMVAKALRPVDGRLWIEDGKDGGTAICFELPADR